MIRRLVVTLVAATAILAGTTANASAAAPQAFRDQAIASGLTAAQATMLQQRVDEVLAGIPGGRQVSPTEVRYDGLTVTFDGLLSKGTQAQAAGGILCSVGWFCIDVRGVRFDFFKCKDWALFDWWGDSPYKNNQTYGTVARFYDQNWKQIWNSTAYAYGNVDVTPFWFFRPC